MVVFTEERESPTTITAPKLAFTYFIFPSVILFISFLHRWLVFSPLLGINIQVLALAFGQILNLVFGYTYGTGKRVTLIYINETLEAINNANKLSKVRVISLIRLFLTHILL